MGAKARLDRMAACFRVLSKAREEAVRASRREHLLWAREKRGGVVSAKSRRIAAAREAIAWKAADRLHAKCDRLLNSFGRRPWR